VRDARAAQGEPNRSLSTGGKMILIISPSPTP
jgi:hypothetical protein